MIRIPIIPSPPPCQAELGAFYPLLLLRPLELMPLPVADLPSVQAVLPCLRHITADAQLLVEVFVNYDCEMRAPNLFERTMQVRE
jgi:brefeldin A-inhibited guanine nucleotide-exchange protein